jgi:hypothetical protein
MLCYGIVRLKKKIFGMKEIGCMKRTIKFKCWTGKHFITDDFLISPEGWVGEMRSSGTYNSIDYVHWVSDWKLVQYTGIDDKHGNPVFEGDILSADWGFEGLVEWDKLIYAKIECTLSDNIEVIGNLYENPELLNN